MYSELIAQIKSKKELKGIPDEYIAENLKKFLPDGKKISKKDEKIILKTIRRELRKMSGRYHISSTKEHLSTKERMPFYPLLNKRIAMLAPKRILDLGAGQNPLYQATKDIEYYAYDINEQDVAKVKAYFSSEGIIGKTKVTDITQESSFPEVDLVLAYKILDIIDKKGHANATKILRLLKTTYLLASFPTISLSGKRMQTIRRLWFEKALTTNSYSFETFSSSNELFYLARRTDKVSSTG